MPYALPKDFLWGGSTSAFQYEGGASEGGRGQSVYDALPGGRYATASDFYHHWREDIDLMAEMGFTAFRLSISWTRIYPNGDDAEPNPQGIAFYRQVFGYLRERGIEPVVTLYHWDLPLSLSERFGGWLGRETVGAFLRYCRTCFEQFGDQVRYWLTLNEDNLCLMLPGFQVKGPAGFGPGAPKLTHADEYAIYHNTVLAHLGAVSLCHEMLPGAQIGCMLASSLAYPLTADPTDVLQAQRHNQTTMYDFLDACAHGRYATRQLVEMHAVGFKPDFGNLADDASARMDFISFSYYFSICVGAGQHAEETGATTMQTLYQGYTNPYLTRSTFGWTIDPRGLRILMNDLYERYDLPLMIVENGLGVKDDVLVDDGHGGKTVHDDYRVEYLRQHIQAVEDTVAEDHVPVLGYLPWGCIDILSASGDAAKRYGFVYVDFDTPGMPRWRKDSFAWYQHVIATHGAEL